MSSLKSNNQLTLPHRQILSQKQLRDKSIHAQILITTMIVKII